MLNNFGSNEKTTVRDEMYVHLYNFKLRASVLINGNLCRGAEGSREIQYRKLSICYII